MRYSKQPGRSSALRSISNNAKEKPIVGLSERIYESTKLAALFDALVDQGCPAGEILGNVNLTVDEVHSPKSRISLAELMTACKNAIRLSNDPHLPYRIGTSIHISAYGMYGFAILCCPDFRKAMAFAELYHALAAPLATIEFTEEDGLASWVIDPNARAAADPQLDRFITEMQIGIHISLMRDVMGAAFIPDRMSPELCKPDQPDHVSVGMARSGCKSRQQDDLPSSRGPLRRPAQRSGITNRNCRNDSCASASEYHQPSDPRRHSEAP